MARNLVFCGYLTFWSHISDNNLFVFFVILQPLTRSLTHSVDS